VLFFSHDDAGTCLAIAEHRAAAVSGNVSKVVLQRWYNSYPTPPMGERVFETQPLELSLDNREPYQSVLSCDTLPDGTDSCREYWDLPGALAVAVRRNKQELAERRAIQDKMDKRKQQESPHDEL